MTTDAKRFAFYGRVSTEDHQDPKSSMGWQKSQARALLQLKDAGEIVVDYFDIGQSRSLPWKRRPQARALLDAVKSTDRQFDGIVIGESARAFFGNQFADTFPMISHYGVELWIPELNGPIRDADFTQQVLMTITGAMSRNERRAMQIRVTESQKALIERVESRAVVYECVGCDGLLVNLSCGRARQLGGD